MHHRISDPIQAGPTLQFARSVEPMASQTTIFIIDHDAAVRDALSATLHTCGFVARTYDSAGHFLDTLPIKQRGCLLVEFDLKDMTGVELITRLSAERIKLPAIIMSARLRWPISKDRLPTGVSALLQKPFGQDELLHSLHLALNSS